MGCCQSENLTPEERAARNAEKQKNQELASRIAQDHLADQQVNKLLLLGAGESGKSTLFKQMISIYGTGFPEAERRSYISIIYNNIITAMKVLVSQSQKLNLPVADQNQSYAQLIDECKGDEEIDERLAQAVTQLWNDNGIQGTYEERSNYQLPDSAAYFFERVYDVCQTGYIPSEQDVLRSRVRTTGIVENEFTIDGNKFKMYDVGGQRNERKKWIHCFENVTAVIFCAAISEYDQALYEDETTNRVVEALNLFEEICNSRWFRDTAMILFLNKRDLFADKIKKVPLSKYFSDYTGDDSFEQAASFMQEQFENKNRHPDKQIYTHITCATDTGNIAAVFNAVKDIIIRKSLGEAGLV